MRRLSATYIYTGKKILKKGIIETDDEGKIFNIIDTGGELEEQESMEFFTGVLVPGFVNTHCHLELSHMKGVISDKTVTGLPGFIDEIITKRDFPDDLFDRIQRADYEMYMNGIAAVGDISNTNDSYRIKEKSKLYYNTFVETFSFDNKTGKDVFKTAEKNLEQLHKLNLTGTIVPHAAYSVPDELYDDIIKFNKDKTQVISIHNQETESEDELIQKQTGRLADVLTKKGFNFDDFSFPGNTGLESSLSRAKKEDNLLLIHNTFSKESDIEFAENFSENIYWVFCPLSNLYIEKTLPDIKLFFDKGVKTCFGTDSYTSNHELSILSELKTVVKNFPEIKFERLIESACLNGARALKIENKYGSLEEGKTPGINLISDFDFDKMTLKETSRVKVLI